MITRSFSRLEEAILDELATYQYLTALQLLALEVSRDRKQVYAALAGLKRRRPPMVQSVEFGAIPGRGRLAAIHALTPQAGALLAGRDRAAREIPVHKRIDTFKQDYDHRVWTVDFHIAVRRWAHENGHRVDFFHTYYDPGTGGARGRRAERKTRISCKGRWIEPDAIFALTDPQGTCRLFVYELYVGKRTRRVEEQLANHFQAMEEDAVETAYKASSGARLLIVLDDQKALDLVRDRLCHHPFIVDNDAFFFLSTRAASTSDFYRSWQRFSGATTRLF